MDAELKNSTLKKSSKEWWDEYYRKLSTIRKEPSSFLLEHTEGLSKGAKVLDLACGTGRNAVALALKGFDVLAIDFSEVALEKAESFAKDSGVKIQFKKMDLDFLIPDLLTFDLIAAIDFKPPPTLINNVIRGLKKNGKLVVESPLVAAMKERPDLELSECFKAGELLKTVQKPGLNFGVVYYSELDHQNVRLLTVKTEML